MQILRVAIALGLIAVVAPRARAEPTGAITGIVIFEGAPPERAAERRDTDPYCARGELRSEAVIVTGGKLKDVLVRLKNGSLPAPAATPRPPVPPVLIDQRDCRYAPRVVGVVVGQPIAIRNSDGTFHTVHGSIAGQLVWNKPAATGDPDLALPPTGKVGDVIDIACDVHPWMHAYAVVQDHTAFAVTGEDGAFTLKGLRPGTYTVEAWHPVLGMKSTQVTIGKGARAAVTARFAFGPTDRK